MGCCCKDLNITPLVIQKLVAILRRLIFDFKVYFHLKRTFDHIERPFGLFVDFDLEN